MKLSLINFILNKIKSGLCIFQSTDTATQAISSGKYVFWKNQLKKASTDIAENDTLSMSNLGDVSGGALNEIADHIGKYDTWTSLGQTAIAGHFSLSQSINNFRYLALCEYQESGSLLRFSVPPFIIPVSLFKASGGVYVEILSINWGINYIDEITANATLLTSSPGTSVRIYGFG